MIEKNWCIDKGWLLQAKCCPSPNYNNRPDEMDINLLVIHNISLPPGEFGGAYIEDFFCNQLNVDIHPYFSEISELNVAAHCLIKRDGKIIQFVPFHKRAWHAGRSCFQGREECNDFSIGIELEGTDSLPYELEQYHSLVQLTACLQTHYPTIKKDRIAGHSDIAPGRKTDPGEAFDWNFYLEQIDE